MRVCAASGAANAAAKAQRILWVLVSQRCDGEQPPVPSSLPVAQGLPEVLEGSWRGEPQGCVAFAVHPFVCGSCATW